MYIYKEPTHPPITKFELPGTFSQDQVDGLQDFILKYPFMSYAAGLPYTEIRSINVPAEDYYISINAPIDHFFRGGFINLTTGKVYSLFDDYHNYLPEPDVWDMAWGTSQGTYDQTGGIALTLQVGANGIYVNPDMSELYQDATLYAECQSVEVDMNIITGYRGEPHITAAQDRAQNQGCYGEGSYILDVGNKLAATAYSATEIHVADGVLSHQGCVGVIDSGTYDVVEIDGGTQGYKRKDLIVCRYEKDSNTYEESLTIMAIKGTPTTGSTPATPSYISGDIQGGDLVADMPLFEVLIEGVAISSITQVASGVKTQAELDAAVAAAEARLAELGDFARVAYDSNDSTSDKTYNHNVSAGSYLVVVARANSTNSAQNGLYLIRAHSSNSSVLAVVSSSVATVSVSGLTITVRLQSTYSVAYVFRI